MNKYITNFSRGCFHHWSISKAVMELVQNFLDSDGEQSYSFGGDYLELTNKNIRVSNKLLMMGKSDKRNDDTKRGQFGVGSIQAMVVLTDLDVSVTIKNNGVCWTPTWEHCDKFGEEIMVIEETPCNNGTNFTVVIEGLSDTDIDEIKQRCFVFQDREVLYSTQYGDIVESFGGETGEVFCGDIFVCQNRSFKYSYNFKPKGIKLSQDRDAVSQWDLQELTAKLIVATGDSDFIKQSIEANTLDTRNCNQYWFEKDRRTPEDVNDKFAEEFLEGHGKALVTSDYDEHQSNEKLGNKSVYIGNSTIVKAIQNSSVYQEALEDVEIVEKESFSSIFYKMVDRVENVLYNDHSKSVEELREWIKELRERADNDDFS